MLRSPSAEPTCTIVPRPRGRIRASAGIGRATGRLFGERGARVALIARGQAGLDGAVRDVQEAGGEALAISADVADYEQVAAVLAPTQYSLRPG